MKLIQGDSLEVLKKATSNSIDTIITDPPYGLSFMGKKWDYDVPSVELWVECLRVLKPGGTLLTFAGSRTSHRMAVNVEDAGFTIKDTIMWLYGSGFPKATDISKQLDKGRERKETGKSYRTGDGANFKHAGDGTEQHHLAEAKEIKETAPATPEAQLWNGWKSHGLKPAYEPIIVARKPNDGTYANNALKHGVSGLNIDGGRIPTEEKLGRVNNPRSDESASSFNMTKTKQVLDNSKEGRFPANIILDEEAGEMLDEQSGVLKSGNLHRKAGSSTHTASGWNSTNRTEAFHTGDKGGASRFFYCAKASKKERNEGCEGLEDKVVAWSNQAKAELKRGNEDWTGDGTTAKHNKVQTLKNSHPTVKPLALMEYLCTLTKTPTGGVVLDPFMGSGTTGVACKNTGRDFIGIELDKDYFEIAKARINKKTTA